MSLTNDFILQMNVTDAPMQLTTERFFIHDETLQDAPVSHRQTKLVNSRLTPEPLMTPCRTHSFEMLSIIADMLCFCSVAF